MSQARTQSFTGGSVTSGRSSQTGTQHADYRKLIRNNGIFITMQVAQYRRSYVAFSTRDFCRSVRRLCSIKKSPMERRPSSTLQTALKTTEGLPGKKDYGYALATAKADVHCGYPTGQRSNWEVKENAVIDHQAARRLTQPAKGDSFPYLVLELKSEATCGTLWQAENQASGSGACCVNAARWILQEAYPSVGEPSVVDTIASSACVNHRLVVWIVHWYDLENKQHYMPWIVTHDTIRQMKECNHLTLNILDHCQGARQANLQGALVRPNPVPAHWKKARLASTVSPQATSEDNEDMTSQKGRRTGCESRDS